MRQQDNGNFSGSFQKDTARLDALLRVDASFDMVTRDLLPGGRKARLYFIDGFVKDDIMEKIMNFLLSQTPEEVAALTDASSFANRLIAYVEVTTEKKLDAVVDQVLSGPIALLVDGFSEAILIDARTYPVRSIQEPEDDKVLRGPRDGFVETLVNNTALLRRRIRDPGLTMEIMTVGSTSKTDVVLCYLESRVDKKALGQLQKEISALDVRSLSMGQESLAEALVKKQWYNPFPKVRYTERPDAAAASVCEGKILVMIDTSPAVMILPAAFFDFSQDTNDFYFPPLVGSYLRVTRFFIFLITLFLTPAWYLLIRNPELVPSWLSFIQIAEPNSVPVIAQLLIIELIVDSLKQASLNTPSSLNNSFSVVGALIMGEFAVSAGWFVPEVLMYMAFVAISTFTQPSFEMGYAFKLCRVMLLILTALFNLWGFAAGILVTLLLIATTKTVGGRSYLFPLIPFDGNALLRLLIRRPLHNDNS